MTSLRNSCEKYYQTTDFYEILGVDATATEKQLKKAYHNRSLLIHPDRVPESEKLIATEKFKVLSQIHLILQDADKRKIYDETGDVDEESLANDDKSWMEYWRLLFKKIEVKDIDNYKKTYIGSENEIEDVKKAYLRTKGNMGSMLQYIQFADCDSEDRYMEIIRELVDAGEIENYPRFFKEPKAKKLARRKKQEQEAEEVANEDFAALETKMAKRREERSDQFFSMIDQIEAKYAKSGAAKRKKPALKGAKGDSTSTAAKRKK